MYNAKAYSVASATSPLGRTTIPRRDSTERDVQIEIIFCGVCHSDFHQVRNEWSSVPTVYPIVPGHEIVGRVTKVGSAVTKYKPGDLAGVGCMVDSDGTCAQCKDGLEQYCRNVTFTRPLKSSGGWTSRSTMPGSNTPSSLQPRSRKRSGTESSTSTCAAYFCA